jgi:hypothetical protein
VSDHAALGIDKTQESFYLVLSIKHLNKMCKHATKVSFSEHPHEHVEVKGQWVTVRPEAANSHRLIADVTGFLLS